MLWCFGSSQLIEDSFWITGCGSGDKANTDLLVPFGQKVSGGRMLGISRRKPMLRAQVDV